MARRAERRVWTLAESETVAPEVVRYLNRLSDLLFVLARVIARHERGNEVLWRHDRTKEVATGAPHFAYRAECLISSASPARKRSRYLQAWKAAESKEAAGARFGRRRAKRDRNRVLIFEPRERQSIHRGGAATAERERRKLGRLRILPGDLHFYPAHRHAKRARHSRHQTFDLCGELAAQRLIAEQGNTP